MYLELEKKQMKMKLQKEFYQGWFQESSMRA